ncbi:MAG: IclR family transcriptional regulator [Burkholderiales bacterium]|nr:IclR family transcriptional regulator [Burkholderiales bacterium]
MESRIAPVEGAQSIDRAVALLRHVAMHNSAGITLAEVAHEAGLKVPTAHRMLGALAGHGLVMQRKPGKRWYLGVLAYELGLAANCHFDLRELCTPVLARLSRITGDTVFLTTRSGIDSVVVERREGSYPIKVLTQRVGERRPLGSTVAGVALLAALSETEIEDAIRRNRPRLTRYGRLSEPVLRHMLERTRALGYALNAGDLIPEVTGIGVVVPTRLATPYAALSVVAVNSRFDDARRDEVARLLHAEAQRLGRALAGRDGHRG